MYGDTAVMRRHAATLRDQAADIRAAADLLVGRAEQISWAGRAAEAMHLLNYKLEQLRHHVKASSRILNDLRTMRRLLLGERRNTDHGTQMSRRVS